MRKSNIDHVVFRNNQLFCSNCGSYQAVPFPIAIPLFTALNTAFIKMHKSCPKTWEQPTVNSDLSVKQKADWWLQNGERGISSETMFEALSGRLIGARGWTPSDPDDFRRCYLLLQAVPEWKSQLDMLRPLSTAWSNLVDNWDKLTVMLEEQIQTKKPNGMYQLMKTLGC
jgi:hypothetical protein